MGFRKSEQDKLRKKQEKLRADFLTACERGSRDEAEALIAAGVNVNDISVGTTPLFIAVNSGNLEVTKLLIERKANVNAATAPGPISAFELFPGGSTPLLIACRMNYRAIAEVLVTNGADIKAQDSYGLTALHYAAKRGNLAVIKMLLEKGADINAKDKFGHTPEFFARDNEYETVADFLKEKIASSSKKPPQPKP